MYPTTTMQNLVDEEDRMFRLAICDDAVSHSEQLATTVRTCLSGNGGGMTVDCFATLSELKKAIKKDPFGYHLVVMETAVGTEDGIDAAHALRQSGYVADIVFYTADSERALEAFGAYPIGYILKPCGASELCRLVTFVAGRNGKKPSIILNGVDGRKNGFCVDDIIYIEVFRTELEVHCTNGKTTCVGSLREACEMLPEGRFYRSHRSFIVNLGRVKRIEKYQFTMDNGAVVTVAKNRYAEAKRIWREYL